MPHEQPERSATGWTFLPTILATLPAVRLAQVLAGATGTVPFAGGFFTTAPLLRAEADAFGFGTVLVLIDGVGLGLDAPPRVTRSVSPPASRSGSSWNGARLTPIQSMSASTRTCRDASPSVAFAMPDGAGRTEARCEVLAIRPPAGCGQAPQPRKSPSLRWHNQTMVLPSISAVSALQPRDGGTYDQCYLRGNL